METDYKVKLEVFEGPLDLLLYLIKRDEIDIYDISIERITRQYLEYLQAFKELKIDIAGEFVVMAANLIYLKSRSLLPLDQQPPEEDAEEDDPRWDLIRQLIEYKKFKEAAAQLHDRALEQERIFTRDGGSAAISGAPLPLHEVGIFQLIHAFQEVIKRVEAREDLQEIFGERFSVSDKIEKILERVGDGTPVRFSDLFVGRGWEVEGWTKSAESAQQLSTKPYPVLAVDLALEHGVRAQTENFDAVIHCASTRGGDVDLYRHVYLDGARRLLERFTGSRILFTSSTSVYAQTNGEWITEESDAEPKHERGKILRKAEDLVLANLGIVIRLGGIYGPARSALLKKFLTGDAVLDLGSDRFANQIHRDDATAAIQLLLQRGESAGGVYNVVDDEPILRSECYRWLATKLSRPLPPTGRSTSKQKRGESNKRVSNAKLRAIGWVPRYPSFADGMEQSVLPNLDIENA